MAFSPETWVLLNGKIKHLVTDIQSITVSPDRKSLIFTTVSGHTFTVAIPSDSVLTEDIKATVDCGAVSTNEIVVKGLNLTQFAKRILQKDLAPRITITSTESASLIYERGIAINPTLTIKVDKVNATDADIKTITLSSTPTDSTFNGSVANVNPNSNVLTKNVTMSKTQTYKVTASNAVNRTANKSITFTFVNPTYWGSLPESLTVDTVTQSDVITGTKELIDIANLKNKTDQEIFNVNMQKIFICYPAEYGNLSGIKDVTNGFQLLTGFKSKEINMTMVDGLVVKYKLYLADLRSKVTDFPIDFTW